MSVSNNKSTTSNKRNKRNKISKRPKSNDRLSFATWVLLIISFTLLTPVRDKPHCNSLILFTMWLPVSAEACF